MRKGEYIFKGSFNVKKNLSMKLKTLSENSTYALLFACYREVLETQFCEVKMFPFKMPDTEQ